MSELVNLLNQLSPEVQQTLVDIAASFWETIKAEFIGVNITVGGAIVYYIRKYFKLKAASTEQNAEIDALNKLKDEVIADSVSLKASFEEKMAANSAVYQSQIDGWKEINSMLLGEIPMSADKLVAMAQTIKGSTVIMGDVESTVLSILQNKSDFEELVPYTEQLAND